MRTRIIYSLFFVFCAICFYMLSNWILENFISHGGEAFYKGRGHLLREDLELGLLIFFTRYFMPPFLIFLAVVLISTYYSGKGLLVIFAIWSFLLCLISIYLFYYLVDIWEEDLEGWQRVLEISLLWFLPWLAALSSLLIIKPKWSDELVHSKL